MVFLHLKMIAISLVVRWHDKVIVNTIIIIIIVPVVFVIIKLIIKNI